MTKATEVTRALMARLASIRIADGYLTDIGLDAHRGSAAQLRHRDIGLPFLTLHGQRDRVTGGGRIHQKCTRDYVIEVVLAADDLFDEQQDAVLYDLRHALGDATAISLTGVAIDIRLGDAQLDDPDIGSDCAVVRLPLSVDYTETYAR